jgi:hypothetical protein
MKRMLSMTRRRSASRTLLLLCVMPHFSCGRPAPAAIDDPLPSLREFMEAYGRDLAAAERAALGQRYDTAGSLALINGRTIMLSSAETTVRYLENWTPPLYFAWDTLSYNMIQPEIALVTGRFRWMRSEPDTLVYSYAGVLRLTAMGWRIRAEIETLLR